MVFKVEKKIVYFDREKGELSVERVFGKSWIIFLYSSSIFGYLLRLIVSHCPLFSRAYGWWHSLWLTRKKVLPFIRQFSLNPSEFLLSPKEFTSFQSFFMRKLRPESRPIRKENERLIAPADGRYLYFSDVNQLQHQFIKGRRFSLSSLLRNTTLAKAYANSSLILARLAPVDCHRFLFPCAGQASATQLISGKLCSVNPIALWKEIAILCENRRFFCEIVSNLWGRILMIEIGATHVGSVHYTYRPNADVDKGQEKGVFSLGGSAILLLISSSLFLPDQDLKEHSGQCREVRCLMGQSLGRWVESP